MGSRDVGAAGRIAAELEESLLDDQGDGLACWDVDDAFLDDRGVYSQTLADESAVFFARSGPRGPEAWVEAADGSCSALSPEGALALYGALLYYDVECGQVTHADEAGAPAGTGPRIAIADLRERAGLTQAQLAERASVTTQALQNYEYGRRDIKASRLVAVARALGATTDQVLGLAKAPRTERLSPRERTLLEDFRAAAPEHKAVLCDLAALYGERDRKKGDR